MPVHVARAIRSPFAPVDGALAGWHPVDLTAEIINAAIDGLSIDIDELYVGCAEPVGAQGADLARAAVLTAGWPDHIGGTVLDRAETSGTAALHAAAAAIAAGTISAAVVVGVCSASFVPPGASALGRTYGRPWGDGPAARADDVGGLLPAPVAADRAAARIHIDRAAQDAWATGSIERRVRTPSAAIATTDARPGDGVALQRGTPVATDAMRTPPEDPAALPPSFDADGTVTGFTFAPPADGATALVLTAEPLGPEIVGVGRSAGPPSDPTGNIPAAVAAATDGHDSSTVDRWELNEPTAAATLLAIRGLSLDPALVNPAGGTLAVGDAGAAEELRLVADALAHLPTGELLVAAVHGPCGAAATVLRGP